MLQKTQPIHKTVAQPIHKAVSTLHGKPETPLINSSYKLLPRKTNRATKIAIRRIRASHFVRRFFLHKTGTGYEKESSRVRIGWKKMTVG